MSKKIFNEAAQAEAEGTPPTKFTKPDKLNLLCYSSGLDFIFTFPIWLWSEGFPLLADFLQDASVSLSNRPGSLDHGRLAFEFIFNGTFSLWSEHRGIRFCKLCSVGELSERLFSKSMGIECNIYMR